MAVVLTKTADKVNVLPGDIVTYQVTINNTDDTFSETNITFTDIIPKGTTFIKDSFFLEDKLQLGKDPNVGVPIPDIPPLATTKVKYDVLVDEKTTSVQLVNIAQATSILSGTMIPITYESNPFNINIAAIDLLKSADKYNIAVTEEITYSIIINNIGAVELKNPILKDLVPECLSFVDGSFSINGILDTNANPNNGINLENILPGQILNINFRATVICTPCLLKFVNTAALSYEIETVQNGLIETNTITTNKVITTVSPSAFKQLSREEYIKIPCQKPDMEEILNTLVNIEITDTKVIKTPVITSLEGQKLTGFKLIVEGVLNQKVEYVACDKEQSVHAAHSRVPFSSFIVLPKNYVEGTSIKVEGVVEDIYTKLVNKRTIFKNITFIIRATYEL
ncbi:SPOCS domain-containing protein [Clostridium brassicae]|uniref:DUF3794 domain-containing protein n=1 Tax=Clostridium brassicae TaxID=2999072 RepID=A0ABT4DCL7_9CLOT|nr:SPOCS domain-containing protein [Clostridium brassicae]MCY6958956.1 DUF3794 domain-containing protein [Clostridium brassicae]